jgi:hypothetical protein
MPITSIANNEVNDFTNSPEFIALIDERCNAVLQANSEYKAIQHKLIELFKKLDKEISSQIDDLLSQEQVILEEVVYKQGMKDGIKLIL